MASELIEISDKKLTFTAVTVGCPCYMLNRSKDFDLSIS